MRGRLLFVCSCVCICVFRHWEVRQPQCTSIVSTVDERFCQHSTTVIFHNTLRRTAVDATSQPSQSKHSYCVTWLCVASPNPKIMWQLRSTGLALTTRGVLYSSSWGLMCICCSDTWLYTSRLLIQIKTGRDPEPPGSTAQAFAPRAASYDALARSTTDRPALSF